MMFKSCKIFISIFLGETYSVLLCVSFNLISFLARILSVILSPGLPLRSLSTFISKHIQKTYEFRHTPGLSNASTR